MGTIYQVFVDGVKGEKMAVDLCNTEEQLMNMTVLQLKEKITKRLPKNAGEKVQRLIFAGKVLHGNDQLLSHFGIEHMSVIHVKMETIYQVVVDSVKGEKMVVDLCNTDEQFKKMTVLQLKEKIAEKLPGNAGEKVLRLIFAEKVVDGNDQMLSHFGIQQMSVIHVEMETIHKVVVDGVKGEKMVVDLCNTDEQFKKMTVLQLKEKIAEKLPGSAGVEALRLIFKNKMLDGNDQLLSHFGMEHMSVIQVEMETIYQVFVHGMGGEKMLVDLCNTEWHFKKMTVLQLKIKIAEKLPGNAGEEALRLIYENKMLDGNDKLLSHLGIQHMSVIQVVIRVRGGLIA